MLIHGAIFKNLLLGLNQLKKIGSEKLTLFNLLLHFIQIWNFKNVTFNKACSG